MKFSFFIYILFYLLRPEILYSQIEDFFESEEVKPLTYSDIIRDNTGGSYKGVVLGNIISVDSKYRYIFVKPREDDLPRMLIFLDRYTGYTISKTGTRKRSSISRLLEGDRVAVRVFIKSGVIIADEIFYIEGEFEAGSKYERKVFKNAPVKLPQKEESATSGH
jgi:hypothetical protein